MQHCSAVVRLRGETQFEVAKPDVTVAEIVVLRAIHGQDAVVRIQPTRMCKTPHAQEIERLRGIYATDPKGAELISGLWPGFNPRLPVSLKDIEIAASEPPADLPPLRGQEGDGSEEQAA